MGRAYPDTVRPRQHRRGDVQHDRRLRALLLRPGKQPRAVLGGRRLESPVWTDGQTGATARPVCGEIMPAQRLRLASVWAMRGIAARVLAGHSCIRMIWPLVSRALAATMASTLAPFQ